MDTTTGAIMDKREQILTELGKHWTQTGGESLRALSILARAIPLAPKVRIRELGGSFIVPFSAESDQVFDVRLTGGAIYCHCDRWWKHHVVDHDLFVADPDFMCEHGIAAMLYAGISDTYLKPGDTGTLFEHKPDRLEPLGELGKPWNVVFWTRLKKNAHRLATAGLDADIVAHYYRTVHDVGSLSDLSEPSRVAMLATTQAMMESDEVLGQAAERIKARLERKSQ